MDFDAVEIGRDAMADDRHLGRLPFAAWFGGKFIRGLEIVNGSVTRDGWPAFAVVPKYLNLLPATQIKTAVGIVRRHIFVTYGEIPKVLLSHQVGAVRPAFFNRVLENPARFDG